MRIALHRRRPGQRPHARSGTSIRLDSRRDSGRRGARARPSTSFWARKWRVLSEGCCVSSESITPSAARLRNGCLVARHRRHRHQGGPHLLITTPFSFFASASAIVRASARPVFIDVDPHTLNLDPAKVELISAQESQRPARSAARSSLRPVCRLDASSHRERIQHCSA